MLSKKAENKLVKNWLKIDVLETAIATLIFSLILLVFSWLQISKISYNNFDQICQKFNYEECMAVFWQQKSYYINLMYVSLGLILVCVAAIVLSIVKRRK